MMKILMVCMGNICRSPLAEGVVRRLVDRAGMSAFVEVDSAGTLAYHAGEQPDPRAKKVAASRGYDLSGMRARRVAEDDFSHFDLVLAMDKQNLSALERVCPDEYLNKLGLFMEYAKDPEHDEIPDPYYGGPDGFERVLDMCEAASQGLIASISGHGKRG